MLRYRGAAAQQQQQQEQTETFILHKYKVNLLNKENVADSVIYICGGQRREESESWNNLFVYTRTKSENQHHGFYFVHAFLSGGINLKIFF